MIQPTTKAIWYSGGHLVAAAAVYRHLITGGWLTAHYQLNDPNIVNLALAIFEAITVVCVAAYLIWRTPFLAKLLARLFLIQIVIGLGFLAFILFFFFTWHPRMM
jgi:hypothetical protein